MPFLKRFYPAKNPYKEEKVVQKEKPEREIIEEKDENHGVGPEQSE